MLKRIIIFIGICIGIYVFFGAILFFRQREFVYYPTMRDFEKCAGFKDAEKLNINGTRAYFKRNSDTLAVFYHGNAGSACGRTYIKKMIENAGHSFLIVEYAGYSNDDKKPKEELLLQDVRNMVDFIKGENFNKVLLIGESIGGSLSAFHASEGSYDRMLLISPFDTLGSVAQDAFPLYPAKMLVMEDYDNIKLLQGKENIWIIHGTEDEIIRIDRSKRLYGSIGGENNRYIEINGAGHNDMFEFQQTTEIINRFLQKYGTTKSTTEE
ncbi:MAG: hypothetical protein U9M90_00405 [Patescibacteria group bacterium]|nr:hypothetical protein [Patescibacteria group bacterium]